MYSITDKQIDFILNDIRRRGVEMEDLQLNLLDHICCIIEQNLETDGNFEDFYNKTIPKFFKHELWEIEEETINLLIFKHYYTMKKVMIIAGILGSFSTFFGAFFKIMHWPGANILLILGLACIGLFFLPLMFSLKIKEKKEGKDKLILVIGSIVASLIALAAMFKIMHWPGTTIMLYTSIGMLLFIFLPLFFILGVRNPDTKTNTIVTSALILAGTGLLLVLPKGEPSARLSKATVNYLRNEETALSEIKAMVLNDSTDTNIRKAYDNLIYQADQLKNAIIKGISGVDYQTYLNDDDNITPAWLQPAQFEAFTEKENFIEAAVAFEKVSETVIYKYEKELGYDAPTRQAEIDYALSMQPHVKDLICFISNLETKAAIALAKK